MTTPARRPAPIGRSSAVGLLRAQLERQAYPRLQMAVIVAVTGAVGLLCSFWLARLGVRHMALRYPLALLGAYAGFLGLLWCWLRTRARDYAEVPLAARDPACAPARQGTGSSTLSSNPADVAAGLWEADAALLPVIAALLAAGLLIASVYVVYLAPTLFAELLLDGALSYTLYRRLRQGERAHWLATAVRHTALPFALTALFLAAVGAALTAYAPGAHSLGQVVEHARHGPR